MLRTLLFTLFLSPLWLSAQDCDCCKLRTLGQTKFDNGDYAGAKSTWTKAKNMGDAAKCSDLDALIAKAKKKIPPPSPKPSPPNDDGKAARDAADDTAWKYAQGNLAGCSRYLADYPNGRHATEARQCEWDYSDADNDGILNKDDKCPQQKGSLADKGCPPPAPKPAPVTVPTFNSNPIASPVQHGKKSGLTMIPVEGGSYTMGSPESEANRSNDECQHAVTVGNYAIGRYEVTQADWVEVMGSNPSNFKNCDECPVENVSWNDVQDFITKANSKYGRHFRLPTEAEWEYAARGGKKSKGYIYAGSNTIGDVAWYDSNSDSKTHNAGTKSANELGLYDMSGNVREWCQDTWGPYPGCAEPSKEEVSRRVLRGGSCYVYNGYCRVAFRFWSNDSYRSNYFGFRLAQD
jgi:formylglycine-generating enzyme required for sulfatase activity